MSVHLARWGCIQLETERTPIAEKAVICTDYLRWETFEVKAHYIPAATAYGPIDGNRVSMDLYDRELIAMTHPDHQPSAYQFYQMLWKTNCLIVDVRNTIPNYVPKTKTPVVKTSYQLKLVEENPGDHLSEYSYEMSEPFGDTKRIQRLHFHQWPDDGVIALSQLDQLCERIEQTSQPCIWIHCWGGVGRTGTLCHALIQRKRIREGRIERPQLSDQLDQLILLLRTRRGKRFVASPAQYELLRELIAAHFQRQK
jgi:protein tyrosine phosphatase